MRQPFKARGRLREGGNVLHFEWWNDRPDLNDYGVAMFAVRDDWENNTIVVDGLFMGREPNHGTPLFFGHTRAARVPPQAGPA